jgi:hypothetical protein
VLLRLAKDFLDPRRSGLENIQKGESALAELLPTNSFVFPCDELAGRLNALIKEPISFQTIALAADSCGM